MDESSRRTGVELSLDQVGQRRPSGLPIGLARNPRSPIGIGDDGVLVEYGVIVEGGAKAVPAWVVERARAIGG